MVQGDFVNSDLLAWAMGRLRLRGAVRAAAPTRYIQAQDGPFRIDYVDGIRDVSATVTINSPIGLDAGRVLVRALS